MKANLIVDNEDVAAQDGRTFERRDPVSGEVVTVAAAASAADAARVVASAKAAFPIWSSTSPSRRREILLRAGHLLKERADLFVEMITRETGGTNIWGRFNARLAGDMLIEAASLATQVSGEILPMDKPGAYAMVFRRPAGVILSIIPWNAPLILGVRAFSTALACGNTVVLKGSELSPGTQYLLTKVLIDAGLPPGVMNYITHDAKDAPAVVEALIANPHVRRVNFTGSTRTGRVIATMCAKYLKPALLELGGKAPFLVLADADIDNAVRAAAFGAYMHQGQICMSTERILVDETIADEFATKLKSKVETLVAGDPCHSNGVLGALSGADHASRVDRLIQNAVERGAAVLLRGTVDGAIMQPSLLDRVTPDMDIYYEESFGPVACLIRTSGAEEAVAIANDSEYGLKAAIFSRDVKQALQIAQGLEYGCCHINGPTVFDEAQIPLGGMKSSGYGRFGGQAGIAEFTELQTITIEDPDQHYPI